MSVEDTMREAGYEITAPAAAVGAYVPAVRSGAFVYTSGQIPIRDGTVADAHRGFLGETVDIPAAQAAARQCVANGLAALKAELGDLERVTRIIKVTGFVASAPGFQGQSDVLNAASDLLERAFGERGRHARSAVGVAALPRGVCVEVELIASVAA